MLAWQLYRDAGSSRRFMAQVRQAVKDMDYWRWVLEEGADAYTSNGNGGGWVSDPTAARAIYLADNDDKVRAFARKQLRRCEFEVGAGLELVESIRRGMGDRYASALEAHYIDLMTLRMIAECEGVSKAAIQQRIDIALDWADCQPFARLFDCAT